MILHQQENFSSISSCQCSTVNRHAWHSHGWSVKDKEISIGALSFQKSMRKYCVKSGTVEQMSLPKTVEDLSEFLLVTGLCSYSEDAILSQFYFSGEKKGAWTAQEEEIACWPDGVLKAGCDRWVAFGVSLKEEEGFFMLFMLMMSKLKLCRIINVFQTKPSNLAPQI